MKKILNLVLHSFIICLCAASLWLFAVGLSAQALQLSPSWLTDTTGTLLPTTKTKIEEIAQTYQRRHSLGLYEVVANSTENGLDAHRYVQQLFGENFLTQKDTLIFLDIGDRKVEMLSGVESQVSDSTIRNAIAKAKPYLAESDWNNGAIALVENVANSVSGLTTGSNIAVILFFSILVAIVLFAIFSPSSSRSSSSSSSVWFDSGSDWGGGSSGGSGGDSF